MLRYHIEELVSYEDVIHTARECCPQILKERSSTNQAVMTKRLNAYLLLAFLCGGKLPEMAWSEKGKPYFVNGAFHCSISHTDTGTAAVIADRAVGIDLQTWIPFAKARAERVCGDAERIYCECAENQAEQSLRFTRIWTAKEAIAKAVGTGIGVLSFRDIRVDIEHGIGTVKRERFLLQFPQNRLPKTVCCIAIKTD